MFLKKLKIILQPKTLLFILCFATILYVYYSVKNVPYNQLKTEQKKIVGKVREKNDKSIIIDDIIVFYSNNIVVGDYVSCDGKISLPKDNTNFYLFSYRNYLASKKIYYTMNGKCEVISRSNSYLSRLKQSIEDYFAKFKSVKYLEAFILGNTDLIEKSIMDGYVINGINHLFSISGMHVGFIIGMLSFIKKRWIIAFVLIFYLIFLGFPVSMMRAVLFFVMSLLNKKLHISNKILFIYLIIFMLLYNPLYIYNIGFVYSYLISFFLITYSELFTSKNYFINLLKISLIIFLVTSPINIQNNHYLNFLSPFLNVLFIPLVTYVLFPLSFLTALIPYFDGCYYIICSLFESLSLFFSQIEIFVFSFQYMNLFVFILYYLIIINVLSQMKFYHYKKIFYFCLLLIIHLIYPYINPQTIVTFIDVGQGDSTLIKSASTSILIDTGGLYSRELAKDTTIPALRSYGINKLDYLILTHGDFDHMGEAINLVENFKVSKVIFNCGTFNELEKDLIKFLEQKKIKYYSCIDELNIKNNKIHFLNDKDYGNENDNSAVIYAELNNYKFVFMGDAGVEVEEDLIEKYNLQDIDVLKVGHHGSKTSSSKVFIDKLKPKYSVISVGKNNRYGHPNDNVLNNLEDSIIYRTDQNGSIMFKIKNNKLKIETCSP